MRLKLKKFSHQFDYSLLVVHNEKGIRIELKLCNLFVGNITQLHYPTGWNGDGSTCYGNSVAMVLRGGNMSGPRL